MKTLFIVYVALLAASSAVAFALYGADKLLAKGDGERGRAFRVADAVRGLPQMNCADN